MNCINKVLQSTISAILIVQILMLSVFSIQVVAAPPFDSLESPIATPPAATPVPGAASPGTGAVPYVYQTENYFTDTSGNILMNINVWGYVGRPGLVTVPAGSDISTLISLVGGPGPDANMKKIRLNRSHPDENGNMTYQINLDRYAKTGDRSMLIALQPNDTIIVPEDKALDLSTALSILGVVISVYAISR